MHIPPTSKTTDQNSQPQIRLLLQGPPGSGKTYSVVTTFPNPFVVDFDNGLTAPEIRALKIPFAPFYDSSFVKDVLKQPKKSNAFVMWLQNEATKFTPEQTLVIDSLSTLADAVARDLEAITPKGKDGSPDGFWFWKEWSKWFMSFCTVLTELKCRVVLTAHEQEVRDSETGRVLGYKPLLKGQDFSSRIGAFFTDVYRQIHTSTEDLATKKITKTFEWQVISDNKFTCKSRMHTDKKFVPASYLSFKY